MKSRELAFIVEPTLVDEAKGVEIRRSVGTDRMVYLDPILLVDHLKLPHVKGVGKLGFPRHPHRGIETFSIVLKGTMHHKDSIGNVSAIEAGGIQWMTAGDGIWHEEMMESTGEGVEVLQLWFNLPRELKRVPAHYLGVHSASIPSAGPARVLAGKYQELAGAIDGIAVKPTVLDLTLNPGESVLIPTPVEHMAFAYCLHGAAVVADREITGPALAALTDGEGVEFRSGEEPSRWIVVHAPRLNEPVVQFRSFVMNTVEDMKETVDAVANGSFAQSK